MKYVNKKHEEFYKYEEPILLPKGFVLVNDSEPNGPITLNKELDNGKKRNLFSITKIEDDLLYYNYTEFKNCEKELPIRSEFICEFPNNVRPEVQDGYAISCPRNYKIVIDKAFYGRYENDNNHCTKNKIINKNIKECGTEPIKVVKQKCEGKEYCSLVVRDIFFNNKKIYKSNCKISTPAYLNVDYYCVKNENFEKTKFTVLQYYNGINPNSLEENSVSEFYQYSKIHGYDYKFYDYNYNPEREVYFIKIYIMIEYIIEKLKKKETGWIVYVDNDTFITNPNIKLETFLPDEKMNQIHFIIAQDDLRKGGYNGVNSGVMFIKITEWSLDFLMRVLTYPFYNKKKVLKCPEQMAINNILLEFNEINHYVIVPSKWFNGFGSELIYHIMGGKRENKMKIFNKEIDLFRNGINKYNKTNEQLRKEVLEYYAKPRKEQIKVELQYQSFN